MLKGEDAVLLLALIGNPPRWTVRSLEAELGIPRSVVHRSIGRLMAAGLIETKSRRVSVARAEEFLVHAVKYVCAPVIGGETLGIPTAWAAPPLVAQFAPLTGLPPVWPDAIGPVAGIAVQPLHQSAPEIARRNPPLGERLFLIDALRLGDAEICDLAVRLLHERLSGSVLAK